MDIFDLDGEKIRNLRESRGWSRETLSEKSGIPSRTIQDIETGAIKNPGLETIKPLIKALAPKIETSTRDSLPDILVILARLDEKQRRIVLKFLDSSFPISTPATRVRGS